MLQLTTSPAKAPRARRAPIVWYPAAFYPDSPRGYVYIVRLLHPYVAGFKRVRVGGIMVTDFCGVKHYVGGREEVRPVLVWVYVGWSPKPWARFDAHMRGEGSHLLAHLARLKWPMELAVVTPGGRDLEAELKRGHNGAALLRRISPAYVQEVICND